MANVVFGTVIFYGNDEGLCVLRNVLSDIGTASIYDFIRLELDYDQDCRYTIDDYHINPDYISIDVELAWSAHEDLWETISNKLDLQWTGRFEWDDESPSVYNDENKKWFKEDYILDAEDSPIGDYKTFETEDEIVDYLEEKTGYRMIPEEWNEIFYEDDWLISNLGTAWENAYARLWIVDRENW